MTDAAHATPGPLPPQPHRSHGCLWGCLIAALVAIVAIVGAATWGGWYFYNGFKNNGTLKAAVVILNQDQTARAVLGDHIETTSLGSTNYATDMSTGTVESYVAGVKGSKAAGSIEVHAETPPHGSRHIDVLKLTGPDGHKYDLLGNDGQIAPDSSHSEGMNP